MDIFIKILNYYFLSSYKVIFVETESGEITEEFHVSEICYSRKIALYHFHWNWNISIEGKIPISCIIFIYILSHVFRTYQMFKKISGISFSFWFGLCKFSLTSPLPPLFYICGTLNNAKLSKFNTITSPLEVRNDENSNTGILKL